ncbi:MAG: aspartate/glutamate racemase family protein, partial [Clostridiales bacterium]|nr:aspartate/glutamate racemase family protein [Clostridiales bacterium]
MTEPTARLGVIGGMGPQATQIFYQRILDRTEAARDQEHLPVLILSDTEMPDRTEYILSGRGEVVYSRLLDNANLLAGCGCTAIAIPCNTSHYFVDRLQAAVDVPILNMVREATAALAARGRRRVGILATDGTIQTGVYQRACQAQGLTPVAPD